jgi:hypothetical protein
MLERGAGGWREVVEKHHSALVDELSGLLDSELREAVSEALDAERSQATRELAHACDEARRQHAESLNQALRRMRQTPSEEQILQLLQQSCAPYAERLVVLVIENNRARVAAANGIEGELSCFEIAGAPAIVSSIESCEPVVAIASGSEISPALAAVLTTVSPEGAATNRDKSYFFPVNVRQTVVAMVAASGPVFAAPIELLCEAAGMKLESLRAVSMPASSSLRDAVPHAPETFERPKWDELPPDEQRIHLQAQRMARVRVAAMRLYQDEAISRGLIGSDIYGALRSEIDAARHEFLQTFLSKSPTMVDYLHLEILRSLAHDDDRLLGPDYPGPMV